MPSLSESRNWINLIDWRAASARLRLKDNIGRAENRDGAPIPVRAEDPCATDFSRKYPCDAQPALEKKPFRDVGRAGEICFVWHDLGSGNATPRMTCFACENFSAIISLWDAARIIFAGAFQSVAITSRIARACLATVDRLRFSHRSSVRRGVGCDSAFRSMVLAPVRVSVSERLVYTTPRSLLCLGGSFPVTPIAAG